MGISTSEAARRWGISRETIYRRRRNGEISVTGDPPTIDPSEMLRVFGEPGARKTTLAWASNAVAEARAEAELEILKAETERLRAELSATRDELRIERDEARRELQRVLDLLVSQQRLIDYSHRKPLLERLGLVRQVA